MTPSHGTATAQATVMSRVVWIGAIALGVLGALAVMLSKGDSVEWRGRRI